MGDLILRLVLTLWRPLAWLLGLAGLYLKGRSDARQRAALEAARKANEAHEVRNEVENRIARDRDARERLRKRWLRGVEADLPDRPHD